MTTAADMYEQRYRQCREQGLAGWFSGQALDDVLLRLDERMRAAYLPHSGRVLEMGCGAGDQSLRLAGMGYDVAGVDIAPTSIVWANEKASKSGLKMDFRVGNVCDLNGFADAEFDVVLDGHCLHFVIGADRPRFLHSARRVLKPGGWLLVTSICDDPNASNNAPNYDPESRCYVQNGVTYTYQGRADDIVEEVQSAEFEIVWQEITPGILGVQSAFLRLDARRP